MGLNKFISKVLNIDQNRFDKVCIDNEVIESIVFYAKKSYPDEFLAMFDGNVKDKVLYITGLLFLPGERSHTGATFNDWLIPPTQRKWGSVHSHPGPNANPSNADLMTFAKHGPFHIIVCEPYSLATMKAYDSYGNSTTFEVGDFKDKNKDLVLDDLAEIKKELADGADDSSDDGCSANEFNDDSVKLNKYSSEIYPNLTEDDLNRIKNKNMDNPGNQENGKISNNINSQVLEINGQKISGQDPNVNIVIEIPKDGGKPIIKKIVKNSSENSEDNEN